MILNRVVHGDPQLEIPEVSYAKYVIDKLKSACAEENKSALINALTHEPTSFGHLLTNIIRVAKGLKNIGIRKNDVVAICSENSVEFIAAALGTICVGATVTTLGIKYTKDEVLHAVSICQPKAVFCSESAIVTKVQILRDNSCIQHIIQLNGAVKPGVISLDDIIPVETDSVLDYEPESVDASEDVAFVIYAAGTTGVPKGVMLTHRNVVYGSEIFSYANKEKSIVLTIPPLYHLYGFLTTIQYVIDGNLLVYMPKFDHEKFLAAVEKYQVTKILAVPQILSFLSKPPLITKYNLSSVEKIWCATTSALSVQTIIAVKNTLPNCKGIFQAYGLTETSVAVLKEPEIYNEKLLKEGCCGTPLPGIFAKVVDINSGENLEAYRNGEIRLKGPTMMKGFLGNEEASKDIYDKEGFLKTGDIGYYDTNGCFYMTDLVQEVIIYKGQQVVPCEVESVVMQHGAVSECGVVGARHAALGELPTAFVVRKPGADLSEGQLQDYANARLSPHSQLHGVIFVEKIPKSESGKILRRDLRNQLRDNDKGN